MKDPETRPLINADDATKSNKVTTSMIKVLIGICYVNLASNACFSVLASFFDKVRKKSDTEN